MIERKRSWQHKVKPCNDLDGASGRYDEKTLNSGKERWTNEIKNFDEPPE